MVSITASCTAYNTHVCVTTVTSNAALERYDQGVHSSSRLMVQVKSYLAGNPAISLALNDNLAIGRREGGSASQFGGGYGSEVVMLDDCNFHESVSLDRFDSERTLELKPPDGEFALMNYRYCCSWHSAISSSMLDQVLSYACYLPVTLLIH